MKIVDSYGHEIGYQQGSDYVINDGRGGSRLGWINGVNGIINTYGDKVGEIRSDGVYNNYGSRIGDIDSDIIVSLLKENKTAASSPASSLGKNEYEDNDESESYSDEYIINVGCVCSTAYSRTFEELLSDIIDYGVDVNARNMNGETILKSACMSSFDAVKKAFYLITNGAKVNARDKNGFTALHSAANNSLDIVKFLVSQGADVNACSKSGRTPLHIATDIGKKVVLEYLISVGADVNAEDEYGRRPLNLTKNKAKREILQKAGGTENPNAQIIKSKLCYIATAVYNSYDAPEVLCLRQYRDEVLLKSALGRSFVNIYYFFSPPIAEKLKNAKHINVFVRKILDAIIKRINNKYCYNK